MKFDELVEKLMNESRYVPTGYSGSFRSRYNKYHDDEGNPLGGGFDEPRVTPHYTVYAPKESKCRQWFQKNKPDSDIARQGWRSWKVKPGFPARQYAEEFAQKWGLNKPEFNPG